MPTDNQIETAVENAIITEKATPRPIWDHQRRILIPADANQAWVSRLARRIVEAVHAKCKGRDWTFEVEVRDEDGEKYLHFRMKWVV